MEKAFKTVKKEGDTVLCLDTEGNQVRLPSSINVEVIDGDYKRGTFN